MKAFKKFIEKNFLTSLGLNIVFASVGAIMQVVTPGAFGVGLIVTGAFGFFSEIVMALAYFGPDKEEQQSNMVVEDYVSDKIMTNKMEMKVYTKECENTKGNSFEKEM